MNYQENEGILCLLVNFSDLISLSIKNLVFSEKTKEGKMRKYEKHKNEKNIERQLRKNIKRQQRRYYWLEHNNQKRLKDH